MVNQISIFTENKKGAMLRMTEIISDAGINLLSAVTNDSAEYGIVRLIVSDPDKSYQVLTDAGYLCKKTSVIVVEIPDEAGSLKKLLEAVDEACINIDYIYSGNNRETHMPLMIMHTLDGEMLEQNLRSKGFKIL
ncbi:MAG: amino acid-binding protein [Lachnospiraceae bacterium]|nr:amino acid-binding protein [Lachnospiraceae bacterium]